MAGNGEVVVEEVSNDGQALHEVAMLQTFLRGHPKTMGAVQIVIGGVMFMVGVEFTIYTQTLSARSGLLFWGGLMFVIAGALSIAANTKLTEVLVKASLGMNVLCMAIAVIGMVLYSVDLSSLFAVYKPLQLTNCAQPWAMYVNRTVGITAVLLILSLLELLIALYLCVWAFKATCSTRILPKVQFVSDQRGQKISTNENSNQGQDSLVMVNDHSHEQK